MIRHALAMLRGIDFRDYKQLTVVINGDEEISTPGARALITQLGSEHDVVFSCEPTPSTAPNHVLGLATSGIAAATMTVRGKSSHAGVAPELGRNALIELAHQLLQTRDLSDASRGIKFNWTMANAGTTRNVIPDAATAVADVRVQRVADYDAIEKTFRERVGKQPLVPDTRTEVDFERRRPPLEVTDASRALARRAQAIYAEMDLKLVPIGEPTSKVTVSADATSEAGRGVHAEVSIGGLEPSDAVSLARGLAQGDVGAAVRLVDAKVEYDIHGTRVDSEGLDADFVVGGVHATRAITRVDDVHAGSIEIGDPDKIGRHAGPLRAPDRVTWVAG